MIAYLIKFSAYNLDTPGVENYRFCTGLGYIVDATYAGFTANEYFEPRVEQPGLMSREIFADGKIGGEGRASYGEITLINNDGELDHLLDLQVDGRTLEIYVLDDTQSITTALPMMYVPMQSLSAEYDRISIRLRDQRALLDEPIRGAILYAGNNVLPDGIQGGPNLKDTPKPQFLGRVAYMSPVLVNTSKLIYQICTGSLAEVVNVFDRGLYLQRGADYVDSADLYANAPSAGEFRVYKGLAMIRLGSIPAGQITCAAWKFNTAEMCTGAALIEQLREIFAILHPSVSMTVVADDLTALDAVNAGQMGLLIGDEMTYAEAIDQIAGSLGAWWMFDQVGRLRVGRLEAPSGSPVAEITADSIIDISVDQSTINGRVGVAWKITLNHDINYAVQTDTDWAGAVPMDRREWLGRASRQSTVSDSAVQVANIGAQELVYDTLYCGPAYADPEAARRLAMLSVPRKIFSVITQVDSLLANDLIRSIDLGALISLKCHRFGLTDGKLCRVIGIETDLARNQISFRLWA